MAMLACLGGSRGAHERTMDLLSDCGEIGLEGSIPYMHGGLGRACGRGSPISGGVTRVLLLRTVLDASSAPAFVHMCTGHLGTVYPGPTASVVI